MAERLCAHEPCGCEPAPGERYCDPVCERAERGRHGVADGEGECRCGHPACNPEKAEAFASDEAPGAGETPFASADCPGPRPGTRRGRCFK